MVQPIPFEAPAYVHRLLDAYLDGKPLDFQEEPVPLDVLRRIIEKMEPSLAELPPVLVAGMPLGLCPNREDHDAHQHDSESLGTFWCHADQSKRQPYHGDQLRKQDQQDRQ